ncbi:MULTISPECIES: YwqH-like family protein [unclassified Solibacillus]|uniref:YwqH-like family protein n=1 Tax=unclassified Solibacillus TaxID=2637870 RepID=UPI0030D217A2
MSLGYWYSELNKKQSHLNRLETCNSQLTGKQNEFSNNKHLMTKPELTTMTWNGSLATRFDDIRNNGILNSYEAIQNIQLNNVFAALSDMMDKIRQEIESIRAIIARLEAAI